MFNQQAYYRTQIGRLKQMHRSIRRRSLEHKWSNVITFDELYSIAYANNCYSDLYSQWVDSGYSRGLTPTVDRINNDIGYVTENIQFLTMVDNCKKQHSSDYPNKRLGLRNVPKVVRLTKGSEILIFNSAKEAGIFFGYSKDAVPNAISRGHKVCGYIAEYI